MRLREIKIIARGKGVNAGNMKKAELIKAIQKAEGNSDCLELQYQENVISQIVSGERIV